MTAKLGPALELQFAIITALKANDELKALIGSPPRIHQDPPVTPKFPYLMIGPDQNVPDLAQGLDGSEIFFDIHIWSTASPGFNECKKIAAAICAALPEAVTLSENRNLLVERHNEHHFFDQDGITKHGVVTFRALVEPSG